jgi:hypothetical protein
MVGAYKNICCDDDFNGYSNYGNFNSTGTLLVYLT